jgi:hypothetical protein
VSGDTVEELVKGAANGDTQTVEELMSKTDVDVSKTATVLQAVEKIAVSSICNCTSLLLQVSHFLSFCCSTTLQPISCFGEPDYSRHLVFWLPLIKLTTG